MWTTKTVCLSRIFTPLLAKLEVQWSTMDNSVDLPRIDVETAPSKSHKKTWIGLCALLVSLLMSFVIYEYIERKAHEFDEPLIKVLEKVDSIQSYNQYVDTTTVVSDRPLRVFGWYVVDHSSRSYATFSTTTLTVPVGIEGAGNHDFTHDNIAIDDTVYVKIDTDSEFLKPSINDSDKWQRFTKDKIPEAYKNIAISGPILDNLRILAHDAEHLELIRKYGIETIDGKDLRRYRFTLKNGVPKESTVGALQQRLGDEGTIDIWIDDAEMVVERMVFSHPPYTSTTTLSAFNGVDTIVPPPEFD